MANVVNGGWHNVNGSGLSHRRPPTVDEALPYSPFTSIIPFSSGKSLAVTYASYSACHLSPASGRKLMAARYYSLPIR